MKKIVWIYLFLLSICFIGILPQVSYAGNLIWPNGPTGPFPLGNLGSDTDVTFVNKNGEILSGPKLKQKHIIPLVYYGKDISKDIFLEDVAYNGGYISGGVVRIKNVGYFNGQHLVLAMKIGAHSKLKFDFDKGGFIPDQAMNLYPSSTFYDTWIEDNLRQEITDENLTFMLPTNLQIPKATGTQYRQYDYMSQGIVNLIILNSTDLDKEALTNLLFSKTSYNYLHKEDVDYETRKGYTFVASNNSNQILANMNMLYNPSQGHLLIKAGVFNGTYPNGRYSDLKSDTIDSIHFFTDDNKFLIPMQYNLPSVIDTFNENTYQAKINVVQPVILQSKDIFYPTSGLTVEIKGQDVIKNSTINNEFSFVDKDGIDLTKDITLKQDNNGNISYNISKELLKSLDNNTIQFTGTFDLDSSAKVISKYAMDGIVNLTITSKNSDSGTEFSSGTAKIKIPEPIGSPVAQTVYKGTSTADLDIRNLVENLKSPLSDDSIKIVGFKEQKVFSTLDNDTAIVVIKSELTGATAEISVPIIVVEKPKDTVYMQWKDASTDLKTKSQVVDKSMMGHMLKEDFSWSTNLPDRDYTLSVRSRKEPNEELYSEKLETNGLKVDTMIDSSFYLPTSLLNYGYEDNIFQVGIYLNDSEGRATGEPLYDLSLTINLQGSLQIVSIPKELRWTDRTITKGLLNRDTNDSMKIMVIDTRNIPDENKNWTVSAQTESVSGTVVPFGFQWKSDASTTAKNLAEKQTVLTKDTAEKSGDFYSKTWNEDTGILLYTENYLGIGDYSGKVNIIWNLYDTPTAN